jgi:hypothetical protein
MLLWKWLPKTLTTLGIDSILNLDLIRVFPVDPKRQGLTKCCFEDLPKGLTSLKTHFDEPTLIDFYGAQEAFLKSSSIETQTSQLFPPNLNSLTLTNARLTHPLWNNFLVL